MAEEFEDPEGVRGPPVEVIAIEDHGGFRRDTVPGHQCGEVFLVEIVPDQRVVEVGDPVDLDRPRNVTRVIEQDILVRLDHHDVGILEMLRQPLGRNHPLGVCVRLKFGGRIGRNRHFYSSIRGSL